MRKYFTKKVVALFLTAAMLIGLVPLNSAQVLGEEVKKAYEVVIEPTMVYEVVYGFNKGISPVKSTDGNWGAIDTNGNEIIKCEWRGVYPIDENNILVADMDSNWFMLDRLGNVTHSYGNHFLINYCKDNVLEVREDSSGYSDSYYIDFEGNKVDYTYSFDSFYLFFCDGILYKGKYYLGKKVNDDMSERMYVLVDTVTKAIVRTYEGYSEMWVSADDTRLIGKNADNKYVEIDSGSKSVVRTYDGYEKLWASEYDNSILFGINENSDYVMVNIKGEILHNYGKEKIEEVLPGYLKQSDNLIKYDGTIMANNFDYNIRSSKIINDNYFVAYKVNFVGDGVDYHYYLLDLNGNIVEDYGNQVNIKGAYEDEYGKYTTIFKGDTIILLKPQEEGIVYLNTIDGTKIETEYYNARGYYSILNNLPSYSGCFSVNDKFDGLFILYNGLTDVNAIYYYCNYYTNANVIYNDELIFENGELEAVGKFDEEDGYLPIKQNGKWGVIKIAEQEKNYSNDTLNEIEKVVPSEDINNTGQQETTKPTVINPVETITVKAPAKAKIKKVKAAKKKVSLTLKKVKNAKGYLLQYSTSKKFKGAKKKYTTKTRVTIKKLKSKKTYYFRVKVYKLDGKKKVLSKKWSAVKKVKVK